MSERNSFEPGTPNWADLMTTDVPAAKAFYGQVFGWSAEDQVDPSSDAVIYTMLRKDGHDVAGLGEMGPGMAASGMPPAWNAYVSVASVDETLEKVEAAGGSVIMPAMDVMESGRMAVFADPVGAVLSVWQPRAHIGTTLMNEPGSLSWTELVSSDMDASKRFLAEVFGWESEDSTSPAMTYTQFRLAGTPSESAFAGGMAPMMPGMPNFWGVYFAVADCDATVALAQELGGSVLMPPMDIEPGRFAVLKDPQGAAFNVIQLSAELAGS